MMQSCNIQGKQLWKAIKTAAAHYKSSYMETWNSARRGGEGKKKKRKKERKKERREGCGTEVWDLLGKFVLW